MNINSVMLINYTCLKGFLHNIYYLFLLYIVITGNRLNQVRIKIIPFIKI